MITSPRKLRLLIVALCATALHCVAQETASLLDYSKSKLGWSFIDGREFPGAKGSVEKDATVQREGGRPSLKITGDFTGGGVYVAASASIPKLDVESVSFWVKNLEADKLSLRLIEASGRCHQFVLRATPSPDWQQIVLPLQTFFEKKAAGGTLDSVVRYESWGGNPSTGPWKGPGRSISLVVANTDKANTVRTLWISDAQIVVKPAVQPVTTFAADFEKDSGQTPEGWALEGTVAIEKGAAFQADHALVLRKTEASLRAATTATSPEFKVGPGSLEVSYATHSDLTSMDNSYNGTLAVQFLDDNARPLGSAYELGAWFRQTPWKKTVALVQVPDRAVTARLVASINKETPGFFAIDDLGARMTAGETADDGLRRMMFTLARVGHLIYPQDARTASVELWSAKELPENLREVAFTVRDYWGAEQNTPIRATFAPAGKVPGQDYLKYTATLDFSSVPLLVGRYYEIHGEITRPGLQSFSNYTSFAILPEALANQHKPGEIPFSSRSWDQRFKENAELTHRLGIRLCNIWGGMNPKYAKEQAAQVDRLTALDIGVITHTPAQGIEARKKGWETLLANDGAELRAQVRDYFEKFGSAKPTVVNLGDEPHSKGDEVKVDVEAYRIIYQEIKKIDPSIFVVGTSVGTEEDYFKAGFGEWCDAYDFHSYEDADSIQAILAEKYPDLFKKYGFAKPVWATEIGLNSQGMTRQAVAGTLYKKIANFFAGGGANVSWFGLFYPDPEAKLHTSFGSAHNVFDSRYNKYAPKLDAIAYYNAVNGIAIKKFVAEKTYPNGVRLFLFRDRDERALVIAYKDRGRADVALALPGAVDVAMTRIDGGIDKLDASSGSVSLALGEDPLLLSYAKGPAGLPADLAPAAVHLAPLPDKLYRDGENVIEVVPDGVAPGQIDLRVPPFWKVTRSDVRTPEGGPAVRFSLQVAPESKLVAADLAVVIRGGANETPAGLLSFQIPVAGLLNMEMLPIPYGENQGPGVKLVVHNNSQGAKTLAWTASFNGEQPMEAAGKFSPITASKAEFDGPSSGTLNLGGRATSEVRLPFLKVDPTSVYHLKATVRDDAGRMVVQERPVAGFVAVPKARAAIRVDGILDDADWGRASVQVLDRAAQFCSLKLAGKPARPWGGVDDISARIRYLWDDNCLYVAVAVKDNIAGPAELADDLLWRMDGLQFLVDPARRSDRKPGKYEFCIGSGSKGPQAWCTLTASNSAPAGNAPDIKVAVHRDNEQTGDVTYEVALPWSRLVPFTPAPGNNLGFTLIVNDDDGTGRDSFMTWFGNAHTKDVDTVGDLILQP